ncbi:protein SOGA3a isoform X2 [Parambassis ranga]|uniref:Protein SOGA3a isoform X2 n=1 Tax=Parambassis ranga TaxID=210632 RepID=A0A6P7JVU7_9TELE|nr:uncharacterized protein KIAA0408-like isoform X2 [Parambassis ranga]
MWSAFINGSGLNAGGGSGGGYVPAQGWEFVPCSRMERAHKGRGKSRSPLRRISSPPTVFSQIYEPQFGASPTGEEGGGGTQFEILRGQMWPGAEPQQQQQQQQQTQHTRLKKKFDDLKKRHIQDKEEWKREKECLLREVADIQGGENRRILLDLKTVLEEVQAEVKREEEKRSELQLQYTRDRCAWELEKAELKCRIAQLEAREANGLLSGGVQSAAGPGLVASHGPREQHCETSMIRREREEQRRILVDTHSTAMDLRCRLEHNERDWLREKAELLEKFDVERKEWEGQLKDMQRKIEELYSEVRAKHVRPGLSLQSTSTGSSVLSENSSSHSVANRHPPLPDCSHACNVSGNSACGNKDDNCFHPDSLHMFNVSGQFSQNDQTKLELLDELRTRSSWQQDTVDTTELDAILHRAPGCGTTQEACKGKDTSVCVTPQERPLWEEIGDGSMRKNATALTAALEEIARVSEELCSYQDEIRKKGGDKRNQSESLCLPEESETPFISDKTRLEVDEAPSNLSHIFDDLWVSERENWVPSLPDNTWQDARGPNEFWTTNTADPESYTQTSPGVHSEMDTAAPPIPPRTSSWNLCSPTQPDTELHIPESPMSTVRKCHSPCVLVDRKCNSPSIVRKFEAMLQENEGKVLIDGAVTSCSVPANANCNKGCCHNRWSCDASKFTSSKLSTCDTVQKSFSEVNIRSAGKDPASDCSPGFGCLKRPELETPPVVRELPVNLLLSPLEIPPASPNLQGSRRNIMLEQKTAEFNRTLFQAEMGRGVEEQDNLTVTDACSVGYQTSITASDEVLSPKETFQPHCTDVTTSAMRTHSEVTLSLSILDSTIQNPKPLEVSKDKETSSVFSSARPQAELREAMVAPQNPVHHSAVKHKVRTPSSPSRKTQHRAATEASFPEPTLPVDDSSFKKEDPHGAKPQPGRAAVSLQQSSTESKQTQMTQPRHVSDSSRPGPRMMNDHPWKPLTLAAYPRPEGSRSNYGAVERILKNYESAARTQQNQSQQIEMPSSFHSSVRQEETVTELDMPDMAPLPLPPTLRHTQTSFTSQTLTTHAQLGSAIAIKEMQLVVQGQEDNRWNT